MRAIVMHEPGGPGVLRPEEVPDPVAGPGQMLIQAEAIGVSYSELAMRAGLYPPPAPLPLTFGFEAAGVVTATGPGADPALRGRRVVVLSTAFGAYAEYLAVPAEAVTPVPDGIGAAEAVAVANMAAVALCLLRAARLTGSESVLVEVAAGGVGGYLTQLARPLGAARVIGTAGGAAKGEHARSLGADVVLDHRQPGWAEGLPAALGGATLDVVFESIGGESAGQVLAAMTPLSGRVMFYGLLAGPPAITPLDLLRRGLTLVGCGGMPGWLGLVQAARAEVLAMTAEGRIRPLIDSFLPLEEAAQAHQRFEDRAAVGKIILVP
jgi:NADPH:quinone reductase